MATPDFTRKMSKVHLARTFIDRMTERRLRGKVVIPVWSADGVRPMVTTYKYGVKSSSYAAGHHTGEDHATPIGSQCRAVSWGTVVFVGDGGMKWGSAYGSMVVIRTKDGKYDYGYCHLSAFRCRVGQEVEPGQLIALSGDTGNSTGPHVHFEARYAGGKYGSDVHPMRVKTQAAKS